MNKQLFVDKLEVGQLIKFPSGNLTYLIKRWSNRFPGDIGGEIKVLEATGYKETVFEYAGFRKVTSGYNPKPQQMVVIKYKSGPNPNNISEMLLWPNKTMKYHGYEVVGGEPVKTTDVEFSVFPDDWEHSGDTDYEIKAWESIGCEHLSTDESDMESRDASAPKITFRFKPTAENVARAKKNISKGLLDEDQLQHLLNKCNKKNGTNWS